MTRSRNNKRVWLSGMIFLFCFCCRGQDKSLVSGDFDGSSFGDFVKHVESILPCHFYYDTTELDSFKVNLHFRQQALDKVLTGLFQNTTYNFAIDSLNQVFVTTHAVVRTVFPADFFTAVKNPGDTAGIKDVEPEQPLQKLKSALENNL